jgi:hypothetical protein
VNDRSDVSPFEWVATRCCEIDGETLGSGAEVARHGDLMGLYITQLQQLSSVEAADLAEIEK